MALFGNVGDDYTKTGKGFLGRWSSTLSFLPNFIRNFPILGSTITAVMGYADTVIEAGQWLFRGKIGSAATVAAAGFVGTSVNAFTDKAGILWWANAASGLTTGASLGTHARAATEALIGAGGRALGMEPQVVSSYPAAIGSIGGGALPQGPGVQASRISAERGKNADEDFARYQQGEGGVHVNELQSALGRA